MRISTDEAETIKYAVLDILPNARVYLFGSRVYDDKKGGDVDILVLADRELTRVERGIIKDKFYSKFGMQKMDVVSFTFESNDPFKKYVLFEAVEL